MSENKKISLSERMNDLFQVHEQEREEEKKKEIINDLISDKDSQEDFEYARKTIKDMVDIGKEAIEELNGIAKETQQARHYEVLASLIKTTTENAERIIDIRKKKKESDNIISNDKREDISNTNNVGTINNNTYIGTTADLLKMVKNSQKEENIIDVTPQESK